MSIEFDGELFTKFFVKRYYTNHTKVMHSQEMYKIYFGYIFLTNLVHDIENLEIRIQTQFEWGDVTIEEKGELEAGRGDI